MNGSNDRMNFLNNSRSSRGLHQFRLRKNCKFLIETRVTDTSKEYYSDIIIQAGLVQWGSALSKKTM
eukprot:snap_masked-scaffold_28-processed-gene-2.19-mRNA-1 protein AED:1.00 eAED:1.00 QI:0/0/0/0/1/1/2/0/66